MTTISAAPAGSRCALCDRSGQRPETPTPARQLPPVPQRSARHSPSYLLPDTESAAVHLNDSCGLRWAFAVGVLMIAHGGQLLAIDGGQARQLTFDGRLKRDPVFVNQGREIVYAVQHDKPRLVLKRLRLADGNTQRVHPDSPLPEFRPVFSRDEQTFAYLQMTGNDRLTVQVRKIGMPQPIAVQPSSAVIWHAALTPDGQQLLYAASGQLRMRPLMGGKERVLTASVGRNNWPAVSPDGRQIAFGSSRLGNFDIFTIELEQREVQRLTTSQSMDARPSWSPDGKRIAFISTRERNYEVYIMRRDGTGLKRITNNPERDDYPAWHPDSRHLVSVSEHDGKTDLFLHTAPGP